MNNIELKPCPFCGGEAELQNYVNRSLPPSSVAYVRCKACSASTNTYTDTAGNFDYMYKAISAWNSRIS